MPRFRAMTTLVDTLVSEELWAMVEPLLPPPPRPWWGGRIRTIPDRNCFAAIIYLVRTSTPWRLLPARELGCGSPATCWRRLDEWAKAGVFAKRGGDHVGANPVDRGKPGSKIHLVWEGAGYR